MEGPEEVRNGITRRQALKRVGAAGAIAWATPVLTSLNQKAFAQTTAETCGVYAGDFVGAGCTGCVGPYVSTAGACHCNLPQPSGWCLPVGGGAICTTDADCVAQGRGAYCQPYVPGPYSAGCDDVAAVYCADPCAGSPRRASRTDTGFTVVSPA